MPDVIENVRLNGFIFQIEVFAFDILFKTCHCWCCASSLHKFEEGICAHQQFFKLQLSGLLVRVAIPNKSISKL